MSRTKKVSCPASRRSRSSLLASSRRRLARERNPQERECRRSHMSADWEKSLRSPSEDPINPQANEWIRRDDSGRLSEIGPADSTRATSRAVKNAAAVQRLAARLGIDAEELASKIPAD